MPRQQSQGPNNFKKKLTGGEGPMDHHPITFALQARLRGTRTDINPRVSAPVHQPVRLLLLFYPVGFHSVPLGRILAHSGSFSYPPIAASASTPLLARLPCKSLTHALDVSLQHIAQIALWDFESGIHGTSSRTPHFSPRVRPRTPSSLVGASSSDLLIDDPGFRLLDHPDETIKPRPFSSTSQKPVHVVGCSLGGDDQGTTLPPGVFVGCAIV
ncbi:hypothetical protein BJV74DRAFT_886215 [Russula compacta]|nr:hypothetical protein BJV74DRAFT_886215 [Russula compacta]